MSLGRTLFSALAICLLIASAANAAVYTVTKIADTSDGVCDIADCSLREAITAANGSVENDVIEFSSLFSTAQTITLGGTDLIIANGGTLSINGPGAALLTVSGNNVSRVFTNSTGAVTTIQNLRVTGGSGVSTVTTGRGGGVYNNAGVLTLNGLVISGNTAANGGGANNAGTATLTIINTAIFGNTVTGSGGGLQNFSGNTINIINSAVYANTCNSTTTGGGGIQANGTVNIVNSTFSGNTATGGSGGAIFFNGAGLTMTNSTIRANTSTQNGAIHRTGTSPLNIRNSIIAGNSGVAASPDFTGILNSQGNNIIGNVGTSGGWVASDLQNTNPQLDVFGDNGGPTNSYLPLPGSPAIDGGQACVLDLTCTTANPGATVTTDQRGISRPSGMGVDIGSVEVAVAALFSVSGQVRSAAGSQLGNAIVTISGPGVNVSRKTNNFGSFTFNDIPAANGYTLTVSAKGYSFSPQMLNVTGDVTDVVISSGNNQVTRPKTEK